MITQYFAQGFVQQVRRRVVCLNGSTARRINDKRRALPFVDRTFGHFCKVHVNACHFLRVRDFGSTCLSGKQTGITNLTACFCIEWRLVQHDLNCTISGVSQRTISNKRDDLALGRSRIIAQEICRAMLVSNIEPYRAVSGLACAGPCGTCLGLLFGHSSVEPIGVHRATTITQCVLGQIQRETICVIEFERSFTGQCGPFGQV